MVLRKNLRNQHESIKSHTTTIKGLTKEVKSLTDVIMEMKDSLELITFRMNMDIADISGNLIHMK